MTEKLVIGWVGNYRRQNKRFDIAQKYCNDYGHTLALAGPPNTSLHYPHKEMPNYYKQLHVLLLTSIEEAHPLAVYEALSCGTPVAMLDVGDCSAEGLAGIEYYGYLDSETINDCITKIMDNREAYSKEGRKSILERWTWDHWIPSYIEMFQKVTGKRRGIRLVITVDKPGWAWDIMAKTLQDRLMKTKLFASVEIAYTRGVDWSKVLHIKTMSPKQYDVILNHTWQAYNHKTSDLIHSKNIPCANGAAYKGKGWSKLFNRIANQAGAITTVSKVIFEDLREKFPDKEIYHCSRGVDVDVFKP